MNLIGRIWLLPLLAVALGSAACRSGGDERPAAPSAAHAQSAPAAPVAPAPNAPAPAAPAVAARVKAEIGKPAPSFELTDLDGKKHSLAQYKGKTVVLEWFSPACPMCQWAYSTGPLREMPERYQKDGIVWLSVNSEAPANKAASPAANRKFVDTHAMKVPILFDPTGVVGRSYGAKTTPHMFVIDAQGVLVYKGALDNGPNGVTDGGVPVVNYVDAAVADMRAGQPVKVTETRSYG